MGKLTRLELYNFKSYKGLHVLPFGEAFFTCIIGPNGSGKSNSMDAISFVLGIKSSHLRSSHLKDLVYRGRVLKTSVINEDGSATTNGANGAKNEEVSSTHERNDPKSAWVMAVYEDDTGEEQHWKRVITNQGASEYRINNKVVTAQQYNDTLESENILIKARNFLCFQGDVEQIASQSPKELTRLIEQISGSLEFKVDYETLKQVQEDAIEHQNYTLNRRRGINSEIKQYQEQKREADQFSRKAEERDQAIVTHILYKLYHFQTLIEESGVQIQRHHEELKDYRRGIAKYEDNLEVAKKDQAKISRDVGKIERAIKSREKTVEEKENNLVPTLEKIHLTKEGRTKVRSRVAIIARERDMKEAEIERLTKDLKLVEKAEGQWEKEWKQLGRQEGRTLDEADLQQYNKLKEEVNKKTSSDQIKADNLTRQERADEETVNSLRSSVETKEAHLQKLEGEIAEVRANSNDAADTIDSTTKEIELKKKEVNALTSERLRVRQLRTELDEKLQHALMKLYDAEDGRKQSDKELRMRATVADMKRMFPGVRGRISELCTPKQKKYGEAVSTSLGRHLDSIVVDDERTAKECIAYLREQRRGEATFIPLETISVKAINSNLKGIRGTRMAIDTIDYDKSVDRAMLYACGNAIVCDDLSIARHICYEKGVEAKAITLDGSVIHKGGLMTGGRGREHNSRRWEDSDVDNLRKLAEQMREKLEALPDTRRNAIEEERAQSQLAGLEQKLLYAKEEAKGHERNLESKQKEMMYTRRELADAKPKFKERLQELQRLRKDLKFYRDAIKKVENGVFSQFCQRLQLDDISVYEAQQGTIQQEASQKKLEYQQQISRLESRINFERQQLQGTIDRIESLEIRAGQDQSLIRELEAEKEAISDEVDVLAAELDDLNVSLGKQQELFAHQADKVSEERREVQRRSKSIETANKSISSLESEIQRSAADKYALLRRCKLEDILLPLKSGSNSLNHLPVDGLLQGGGDPDAMDTDEDSEPALLQRSSISDYGIEVDFEDLEDGLKQDAGETIDDKLQNRINDLDDELKSMAPNMKAIERLEGVESRLKTTEKDFEDARRRAKKAKDDFQEVKDQRFELFNKAFSHISEQIGPIYKELTRSASLPMGGQAYLDMEDSDEPYLDGIKYHAMPPLKRFRDMEHLSGGEKTMAALALLFAIHSYQPSPFFVLDEVDAALDNANVAKIANYIREHSGPGMQFIVISLKMGLFQYGETLVGIHRDQSANSSRALTLDLRKYQ